MLEREEKTSAESPLEHAHTGQTKKEVCHFDTPHTMCCSASPLQLSYSKAGTDYLAYFTFSMTALKALGLFMARLASVLRLISMPAL